MIQYLHQLETILDNGFPKDDRTGIGTLNIFGMQERYNLQVGFPAVTTKKLAFKTVVAELLWFISGSNNINDLKRIMPSNKIWDANYKDYLNTLGVSENGGSMGRIYGPQWRDWMGQVDQLQNAVDMIRNDPNSRIRQARRRWKC